METQTGTANNIGNIEGLIKELGLRAYDQELFIGKVRGFPVGIKFINSNSSLLLLCQIRYPVDAESRGISKVDYGAEISALLKEKKVEITVEDKIAWLTILDSGPLIESNSVAGILNAILEGLERAGLAGLQDKCHYCQVQPVDELVCRNGKVAQICPACLAGKTHAQTVESKPSASGISKALVMGCLASLVGALAWALLWVGYERLFDLLNTDKIVVPRVVEAIVLVGASFLVGGPIGFILRKIPNRGDLLAGWMAMAFAIGSVVLGETLFSFWLVHKVTGIFSFSAAVKIVPRYLADAGVIFIAEKVVFACFCVGLAYHLSRPQKKGLRL